MAASRCTTTTPPFASRQRGSEGSSSLKDSNAPFASERQSFLRNRSKILKNPAHGLVSEWAERRASKCPCSAYEIPCCASKNSLLRCVGNLLVSDWSCLLFWAARPRMRENSLLIPLNF